MFIKNHDDKWHKQAKETEVWGRAASETVCGKKVVYPKAKTDQAPENLCAECGEQ